jgi:hypothetical protein
VNEAQNDWAPLTPMEMLALNGRDNAISPFVLDYWIYQKNVTQANHRNRDPKQQAEAIVTKLREALDLANGGSTITTRRSCKPTERRHSSSQNG